MPMSAPASACLMKWWLPQVTWLGVKAQIAQPAASIAVPIFAWGFT